MERRHRVAIALTVKDEDPPWYSMIREYLGLTMKIAGRYASFLGREDACLEALLALASAARSYEDAPGHSRTLWVVWAVKKRLNQAAKEQARAPSVLGFMDSDDPESEMPGRNPIDFVKDPLTEHRSVAGQMASVEIARELTRALHTLPAIEYELVAGRFGLNGREAVTLEAWASQRGYSRSWAISRYRRALKLLRKAVPHLAEYVCPEVPA